MDGSSFYGRNLDYNSHLAQLATHLSATQFDNSSGLAKLVQNYAAHLHQQQIHQNQINAGRISANNTVPKLMIPQASSPGSLMQTLLAANNILKMQNSMSVGAPVGNNGHVVGSFSLVPFSGTNNSNANNNLLGQMKNVAKSGTKGMRSFFFLR